MKNKNILYSIPGGFYDLIVYYGGSLLFFTAIVFASYDLPQIKDFFSQLTTSEKIFLSVVIFSASYIFGQFSSTFSAHFVKKPISKLCSKFDLKDKQDYSFNYFENNEDFTILNETSKKVKGNYWTIIYFIKMYKPDIADDLIKRYARCKLARSNSFNFLILSLLSLSCYLLNIFNVSLKYFDTYIGPLSWALVFGSFSIIFAAEFYQRQAWFGDILIKIYAAFHEWMKNQLE